MALTGLDLHRDTDPVVETFPDPIETGIVNSSVVSTIASKLSQTSEVARDGVKNSFKKAKVRFR